MGRMLRIQPGIEFELFGQLGPRTVERVIRLVDGSEYKRRQAPPGVKITPRAFGRDRRLPITNRWTEQLISAGKEV